MDARDAASLLDAVDACGGASVQARVLARLPVPFRKDVVQRLGKTLMQRLGRGSRCPRPHAVLARAMAPRGPAVAVAVVGRAAGPQAPRPPWPCSVPCASRPARRASRASRLRARCAAPGRCRSRQAQATRRRKRCWGVRPSRPGELAAASRQGGPGFGAACHITGDDQKAALAAIQRPGLGSGVDGVRSLLLFV
jgi:hypothetical protein